MKLVNLELSRVTSLAQVRATKGAPFSLDVLNGAVRRYNFQHFPDKVALPGTENPKLSIGVFNGVQIDEMAIFNDGVIVTSRASTDVIDEFLDDMYGYLSAQFSFIKVSVPPETRHYESTLIIELDGKATAKFDFLRGLYSDLSGFRAEYGLGDADYSFHGLEADFELSGTPSATFGLQRRLRVPFDANQWWSIAPLKTKDHISVLENLEAQLLR